MTWTSKPKVDARAVARAMCEAAERRRLAAEAVPLPEPADAMLPMEWRDGQIKLGRHSEEWLDWMGEDAWHAAVLALAGFLTAFVSTVWRLGMMK